MLLVVKKLNRSNYPKKEIKGAIIHITEKTHFIKVFRYLRMRSIERVVYHDRVDVSIKQNNN